MPKRMDHSGGSRLTPEERRLNEVKRIVHGAFEHTKTAKQISTAVDQEIFGDTDTFSMDAFLTSIFDIEKTSVANKWFSECMQAHEDVNLLAHYFPPVEGKVDLAALTQDGVLKITLPQVVKFLKQGNPMEDTPYGIDFLFTFAKKPRPFTPEDIAAIDPMFATPEDGTEVLNIMFLVIGALRKNQLVWGHLQSKDSGFRQFLDKIADIGRDYLNHYYNLCVDNMFSDKGVGDENIFPPEANLLPVVVARMFVYRLDVLPETFETLLRDGLVPTLDENLIPKIVDFYKQRFNLMHQKLNVYSRLDDEGFSPYKHVTDSAKNGRGIAYLKDLASSTTSNTPEEQVISDPISWFTDARNFSSAQIVAGNLVTTIGQDANVAAIDIAFTNKDTLDVILVRKDETAFAFQINQLGRVLGIPDELKADVLPYVEHVLRKVVHYVEENKPKNPKPEKSQAVLPSVAREASEEVHSAERPMTREERIADYQSRKAKTVKRRAVRANEQPATSPISVTSSRRVPERTFHIKLIESETFLQQLSELTGDDPQRVRQALAAVSSGEKRIKPLKEDLMIPGITNMYSVRVGNYRIKLAQSGSGEMVVASVQKRGISYDDLEKDAAEVEKLLSNR